MNARYLVAAFLVLLSLLITAGCTQTTPQVTPTQTVVEPTVSEPTALPTTISSTPGPTQTLPDVWSLDVQVTGNGEAINPMITTTIRGGKGQNFILNVSVRITRADGKVEEGFIKREGMYKVGDSISLPVTSQMGNVNRVEVWATTPQGEQVKIFDNYVPFRTYN